ncbi:MAG TPA: polyprenol monophosphomannose synthase [Actinomycetota bacterium]
MKACVVLPTYNEAATIREVVERVLANPDTVEALIVDDNSPDGTGAIADELAAASARVSVMHRPRKGGLGPAYLAGFAWGLEHGYDAMVEMDSDLSHDPADIARLVDAVRAADVAIGSRYMPGGGTRNWSRLREALSRGAGIYSRMLLRFRLTDPTSGFRCYRREVLETLSLAEVRSEGYGFQIELAWRAWTAGFRLVDVPIVFTERRAGASKMHRGIVVEAAFAVLRWALSLRRAPRSPHPRSVAAQRP